MCLLVIIQMFIANVVVSLGTDHLLGMLDSLCFALHSFAFLAFLCIPLLALRVSVLSLVVFCRSICVCVFFVFCPLRYFAGTCKHLAGFCSTKNTNSPGPCGSWRCWGCWGCWVCFVVNSFAFLCIPWFALRVSV